MKFTNFKINKLWGINSYNIDIEDNKLILVAENGAGKTTILKLMFLFLSKQWSKLKEYEFESISATIDGENYKIQKKQLDVEITEKEIDKLVEDINPTYKNFFRTDFIEILKENNYNFNLLLNPIKTKAIVENENFTESLFIEIIKKTKIILYKDFEKNINLPEIPVMYLPTYRRIEKKFSEITDTFRDIESDEINKTNDIENNKTEDNKNIEKNISDEIKIEDILKIWNEAEKAKWKQKETNYIEVVEFGISDIKYKFDNEDYAEEKINQFIENTENYLINKSLIYKDKKLQVKINENFFDIDTKNILSSGEKQIISMFFYLILYGKKYFIIFDEPEISVSSVKHEFILPDVVQTNNLGFISATHSPFIFGNRLRSYTHDIEEYYLDTPKVNL